MRITSKGQVTIPQEFRKQFGLLPNCEVEFIAEGKILRLVKHEQKSRRGRDLIERMRGRGDGKLTTAQILEHTRA